MFTELDGKVLNLINVQSIKKTETLNDDGTVKSYDNTLTFQNGVKMIKSYESENARNKDYTDMSNAGSGGGSSTGMKYVIVQALPQTGEDNTIYLVPKSTSKTNNYYDEYMYISNAWEKIGDTEIDLSNYAQKNEVLTKTNTTAFTPTGDYQPATKKYVDDTSLMTDYTIAGLSTYSSSSTYAVDDYVYYNNLIYKCNTDIGTAEEFDNAKWDEKTYLEYINDNILSGDSEPSIYNISSRLDLRDDPKPGVYVIQGHQGSNFTLVGMNGSTSYIRPQFGIIYITGQYSKVDINDKFLFYYSENNWENLMKKDTSIGYSSGSEGSTLPTKNFVTSLFKSHTGIVDFVYNTSYNVGDYCYYLNKIYRCKVAHTASYFDNTNWQEKTYTDYLDEKIVLIKTYQLAGLTEYNTSSTYNTGDYCYYNGAIYKCNDDSITGAWDSTKWDSKTYMQYMSDVLIGSALNNSY